MRSLREGLDLLRLRFRPRRALRGTDGLPPLPETSGGRDVTKYLVLSKPAPQGNTAASGIGVPAGWAEVETVEAASADAAIRQVAEKKVAAARYVAVPERSWKPREVTVAQTTKVDFK
jgi:hypothetical protein